MCIKCCLGRHPTQPYTSASCRMPSRTVHCNGLHPSRLPREKACARLPTLHSISMDNDHKMLNSSQAFISKWCYRSLHPSANSVQTLVRGLQHAAISRSINLLCLEHLAGRSVPSHLYLRPQSPNRYHALLLASYFARVLRILLALATVPLFKHVSHGVSWRTRGPTRNEQLTECDRSDYSCDGSKELMQSCTRREPCDTTKYSSQFCMTDSYNSGHACRGTFMVPVQPA